MESTQYFHTSALMLLSLLASS